MKTRTKIEVRAARRREPFAERAYNLIHFMAGACANATNPEEMLQVAIERTCQFAGWAGGQAFLLGDHGKPLLAGARWAASPAAARHLHSVFHHPAQWLPTSSLGQALATGRSVWRSFNGTTRPADAEVAREHGFHSVFALPIHVVEEPAGALVYYATKESPRDPRFAEVMDQIAVLLGKVIEHHRAGAFQEIGMGQLETHVKLRTGQLSHANRLLEDQKQILESILDSMGDGVLVIGRDGIVLHSNPQIEKLLGVEAGKPLDPQLGEVEFYPNEFSVPSERTRFPVAKGLEHESPTHHEIFFKRPKLGDGHWISWSTRPLRTHDAASPAIVLVVRDITEQKKVEKTLQTQQAKMLTSSKMSALGEMASGIAHEINNPLSVILGKTEELAQCCKHKNIDEVEFAKSLEKISATAQRIARIVRGLRALSRQGSSDPLETVPLKSIVEETIGLCQARFEKHGVTLNIVLPETPLPISCRPSQIGQVLLNLLNNAFDAIEARPDRWVRIEGHAKDEGVILAVTDCGQGIPESLHSKILEPFFTTKAPGQGTGLGLGIAKAIVEEHQGTLELDTSHPNTRFIVRLPRARR